MKWKHYDLPLNACTTWLLKPQRLSRLETASCSAWSPLMLLISAETQQLQTKGKRAQKLAVTTNWNICYRCALSSAHLLQQQIRIF